ncbi:MAG: acyl-phosphate glycerol 3-phosphate acyltransferase [Acidobacteria bacterium]|nr:MAG: acyl-phosphate glycerol 3-phosphate acyltransferase [Acidobacteriota bacterium]
MNYPTLITVAVCSYLLGSIPFGYLLVRVFQGIDVRSIGSGNIGATNVARTGGKALAISTLVLDALKGWLPVFLVLALPWTQQSSPGQLHTLAAFAALLAVLGHMFPVWLRFKGGKGVATGLGVFLALAPKVVLIPLVLFLVIVFFTRYVSLGSILGAAMFPVALWLLQREMFPAPALAMCAAVALLVIVRHHQNIGRLLAGKENRFGARKA